MFNYVAGYLFFSSKENNPFRSKYFHPKGQEQI